MLKLKGKLLALTLKALLTLIVILVPLLGVWFASSIAAYFNGPIWLVVCCGLLFFPIGPLLWDWISTHRWKKKTEARQQAGEEPRARILIFWDRLILRTLVVNLALLVSLGWLYPDEGFTALSTRGDWMLTNADGPWVEPVSEFLFATAEGLEFLYHLSHDNPFDEYGDDDTVVPIGEGGRFQIRTPDDDEETRDDEGEETKGDEEKARPQMSWPPPDDLHPLVKDMPESVETSIESVASYIRDHEDDPYYRVKALFDYVADRITYDVASLEPGNRAPQDAETVFETGLAVCAGYALLLVALGEHTGDEIVYISGVSRDNEGTVGGAGHAWNGARINDGWYLLDPTWGAGHVDDQFHREYNPTYLFTPPEVFINTHFPNEQGWQLLAEPMSRGKFMRQPVLRPDFFANGMRLLKPTRSQVRVGTEATLTFENPGGRHLRGRLVTAETGSTSDCEVSGRDEVVMRCPLPGQGTYHVQIFGGKERYGTMPLWGQIEVHGG